MGGGGDVNPLVIFVLVMVSLHLTSVCGAGGEYGYIRISNGSVECRRSIVIKF